MADISKYGIQYGTGELIPPNDQGGVTDPTAVTKRRNRGSQNSFVQGGSTAGGEDPTANIGQDLLNAIQMGNLGNGEGVYSRRESNTFYFKSIKTENGLTLRSTSDSIIIGAPETGDLPRLDIYLGTDAEFAESVRGKFLRVKEDGTGIEYVDGPTGGGSGGDVTIADEGRAITLANNGGVISVETHTYTPSAGEGFDPRTVNLWVEIPDPNRNGMFIPSTLIDETSTIAVTGNGIDSHIGEIDYSPFPNLWNGSEPFKLEVKLSGDEGNALEIREDGLYAISGQQGPVGPAGPPGPKGDKGDNGDSFLVKGAAEDINDLPTFGNTNGDCWIVDAHLYVWTNDEWVDAGEIVGPPGPQGLTGIQGPPGPPGVGIRLLGALSNPAELPTNPDLEGDGYLIDGTFWCWIDGAWEDLGSIKGPQGPEGEKGDKGDKGDQGVSVVGASIDANKHLILEMSAGADIDAGAIEFNLRDLADTNIAPTISDNGKAVVYDATSDKFILGNASGGSGGAGSFTELSDTPSTLSGSANKIVSVNSAGTALTFIDNADTFLKLSDTPSTYAGHATKTVSVNAAGTGLEFTNKIDTFVELADTPNSFTGHAGKVVKVNPTETGLIFEEGSGSTGTVYRFRVNLTNTLPTSAVEVPPGWTISFNNALIMVDMGMSGYIDSIISYGYNTTMTPSTQGYSSGYKRCELSTLVYQPTLPSTEFAISGASNGPLGCSSGAHAYIEVRVR